MNLECKCCKAFKTDLHTNAASDSLKREHIISESRMCWMEHLQCSKKSTEMRWLTPSSLSNASGSPLSRLIWKIPKDLITCSQPLAASKISASHAAFSCTSSSRAVTWLCFCRYTPVDNSYLKMGGLQRKETPRKIESLRQSLWESVKDLAKTLNDNESINFCVEEHKKTSNIPKHLPFGPTIAIHQFALSSATWNAQCICFASFASFHRPWGPSL